MTARNANELTAEIRLLASKVGARLFRRNIGTGWIGQAKKFTKSETIIVRSGDVLIRSARSFHNGEAGQSDTWGWVPVTITADMVGQVIAQHVEIEVKFGSDRESPDQKRWREFVNASGGRAGIARTLDDVTAILTPD